MYLGAGFGMPMLQHDAEQAPIAKASHSRIAVLSGAFNERAYV